MAKVASGRAAPEPRTGMPSPRLGRGCFRAPSSAICRSGFGPLAASSSGSLRSRGNAYSVRPQEPGHAQGRPGLCRSGLRSLRRLDRRPRGDPTPQRPDEAAGPRDPDRQRLVAQRAHLPRRDVEELAADRDRREALRRRRRGGRDPRPSRLAAEYGRNIHPCKACFSTAAALCHWPCSCYPNHSLGQTQDWMNEIYPMWVRRTASCSSRRSTGTSRRRR